MRALMIGRFLPMRIRSIIAISITYFLTMVVAQAATWEIVFYQQLPGPAPNLNNDYIFVGGGTFEIADGAVTPGNLVLFEDSDFLSFDVEIETDEDAPRQLTLGIDDFPHSINNPYRQGILFDDNAQPLRFDTPVTTTGNGASICEDVCSIRIGLKAELILFDDNGFNLGYVIGDGTIDDFDDLLQSYPAEAIMRLGGTYTYRVGVDIGGSGIQKQGYYEISTPPPPCLGDFEPDGDVDGVDLDTQAGGGTGISLADFSQHFGRNDCPS